METGTGFLIDKTPNAGGARRPHSLGLWFLELEIFKARRGWKESLGSCNLGSHDDIV